MIGPLLAARFHFALFSHCLSRRVCWICAEPASLQTPLFSICCSCLVRFRQALHGRLRSVTVNVRVQIHHLPVDVCTAPLKLDQQERSLMVLGAVSSDRERQLGFSACVPSR